MSSTEKKETKKNKSEQQQQQQPDHKDEQKKRKQVFPYGNYRAYYGYRLGQDTDEDPRLKVFKRDWFEGKDCLDIGCNAGIMTIEIAKKFRCRSILGVDIDPDRVKDAFWHLKKVMMMKRAKTMQGNGSKLEIGESAENRSDRIVQGSRNAETEDGGANCCKEINLLDVVSFRNEDFVNSQDPLNKQYDTICW